MKPENLTDEERNYLFGIRKCETCGQTGWLGPMRCPDCGDSSQFLAGPEGGLSQNIMCGTCKSKFNVALPWFAERI